MSRLASQHGVQTVTIPLGIEGAKSAKSAKGAARLLQVAGLSRVKNQRLAIEAVAILVTRLDVHLDLVGEDTMNGALQALARERGLADRVVFHGFVPQDEITPLYGRASLYVQTSLHEAAGVSVLEAASVGVPVVGTRVGYIADWAPRRAVAIDEQTPEALAETIEELLCNPDRGQAVAFSAQTWVLEHDADWTAAEIERLYRVRRVA